MTKPRRRAAGFTLLEVLVALTIFAFGLLAAAGLQLSALQSAQYSAHSGVATSMAREYGELMQMTSASLSAATGADAFDTQTLDRGSAAANACTGATASACHTDSANGQATFAAAMRHDWSARVKSAQALPQGRAEVCRDSSRRSAQADLQWGDCDHTGDRVLIKMGWLAKPLAGTTQAPPAWMTGDRPRFALMVVGPLRDYVRH